MFKFKNFKILLLLMLFASAGKDAWADFPTYYHHWYRFQAEVKTQPTGAAKVYGAFPESNGSISYSENVFRSHKHFDNRTDKPVEGESTGDLTAYLRYDNVADGYRFLHWIDSKGNIITTFNNTQQAYTATVTSDNLCYTGSENSSNTNHAASDNQHPYYTNETFTAVFEKLTTDPAVTVSTEGTDQEQVSAKVSPEDNAVGDEITISTQVNSDASLQAWKNKFLGWKFNGEFIRDGQGNIIRDVSYSFTITENNKGEYVAVYEGDYSFFRIKCLGSPHRYASAIKDGINYASTNLSGNIKLSDNPTSYLPDAGTVLQLDYKRKPSGYSGSYHEVYVQNITASDGYNFESGSYIRITYIPQSNTYLFSTEATGGTRFRDNNGTPTLSIVEDDYGYWYIEPMDKNLETKENYFSLDPAKLFEVDGKYYTTLRTSWNILFNPDQMTPYIVKSVDETAGTFEMEPITGNIIPAGTPVIIETKSTDVEENRMVPTLTAAASGAVPSGNLLQVSTKYFPNQPAPVTNCKGLYKNANGQLAFGGNALSTVNGNEAYLNVANEVVHDVQPVLTETTLANLLQNGEIGPNYKITDLTCVYARGNVLYCKDDNHALTKSVKVDGEIDYIKEKTTFQQQDWDQSNWIAVTVPSEPSYELLDHRLNNVVGRLKSKVNPEFDASLMPTAGGENPYNENTYITCNFSGEHQQGVVNGEEVNLFFVAPKPMEIAQVEWAMWDDESGMFIIPNTAAASELEGAFLPNFSMLENVSDPDLQDGGGYHFPALIKVTEESSQGKAHVLADGNSSNWTVYPLEWSVYVITAIDNLQSGKTVTRVVYYNLMGVESDKPYPGINIVETRYSDGSRTAVKVVK